MLHAAEDDGDADSLGGAGTKCYSRCGGTRSGEAPAARVLSNVPLRVFLPYEVRKDIGPSVCGNGGEV